VLTGGPHVRECAFLRAYRFGAGLASISDSGRAASLRNGRISEANPGQRCLLQTCLGIMAVVLLYVASFR